MTQASAGESFGEYLGRGGTPGEHSQTRQGQTISPDGGENTERGVTKCLQIIVCWDIIPMSVSGEDYQACGEDWYQTQAMETPGIVLLK